MATAVAAERGLSLHVPVVTGGSRQLPSSADSPGERTQLGKALQSACFSAFLGMNITVFLVFLHLPMQLLSLFSGSLGLGASAAVQAPTLAILPQVCLCGNEVSQPPSGFWDLRQWQGWWERVRNMPTSPLEDPIFYCLLLF